MIARRSFLIFLSLLPMGRTKSSAAEPLIQDRPDPTTFETGDLVWPKAQGVYVPYRSNVYADFSTDRVTWETEKEAFLKQVDDKAAYLLPNQIEEVRELTFERFYEKYTGDRAVQNSVPLGTGGGVYVGHVGMIDMDSATQEPWVIEAIAGSGVLRVKYSEWLLSRSGELVWHGRLKDYINERRSQVVAEAINHLSQPYDFWNFDLNDESGFYCSKLIWLSIFRAINIAIDGDSNPKRGVWFSPKQLMNCEGVSLLSSPGDYGTR
jgi:permuted papain-like amidase YaeF/Yiix C92 family enzyme